MNNRREYIGITGFKHLDEIRYTTAYFRESGINKDGEFTGMYGFLIFDGQINMPDTEFNKFPALNALPSLLDAVPEDMLPVVHYCSKSKKLNLENLFTLLERDGIYKKIKGVQINIDWPERDDLMKIKDKYGLQIIQQINPTLQSERDTVKRAINYEGAADWLLIDPSLGAGIPFNVSQTSELINRIYGENQSFNYVVCGGLDEYNVKERIRAVRGLMNAQIITVMNGSKPEKTCISDDISFSVDAEGRLRISDGTKLNLKAAGKYIYEAAEEIKIKPFIL
ncbi:MAG: hypothetical protein ACP5N3_05580 [Candidatus Nanoarchaeia archaeon]